MQKKEQREMLNKRKKKRQEKRKMTGTVKETDVFFCIILERGFM